jgi:hypothetical protein
MRTRIVLAICALSIATTTSVAGAQRTASAFLTLAGADTVGYEQFARTGNEVKGVWIIQHGGVVVHDYALTVDTAGLPTRFTMRVTTPGAAKPAAPQIFTVDFGRDSATFTASGDTAYVQRVALANAYPLLGQSVPALELALQRLRRTHVDSTLLVMAPVTGGGVSTRWPVKFVGADSAVFAGAIRARVGPDQSILGMAAGPLQWRSVPPTDVDAVVRQLIASSAQRTAAAAAAQAARLEIAIAPQALEKFVGKYAFSPTVSAFVTRDGEHLAFRLASQASAQLYAEAPARFFMKTANVEIEFVLSPSGDVTSLDLIQGGARQRAVKRAPHSGG